MQNQPQRPDARRRAPLRRKGREKTKRSSSIAARARAVMLCALLALGQTLGIITSCTLPTAATAAEPGQTVEIEAFGDNRHQVAGSGENAFCIEPGRRPGVGTRTVGDLLGHTSRNPEKYWDQESVTTIALAAEFCMEKSGLDRGAAYDFCQGAIWRYVKFGNLDMSGTYAALSDAMNAYVEANRDGHIGKGCLYYAEDGQSTASLRVEEILGGLTLVKSSSDASVSGGNALYNLEGAVYGIYSDGSCSGEPVATLRTNSAGSASADDLKRGSYWVKEISPSAGYALDESVYSIEVPAGSVAALAVGETPQTCDVEVAVRKVDAETGEAAATGTATLANAEFRIEYYAGRYDEESLPASPDAVYTVVTDDTGAARLDQTLPLGTAVVRETKAPEGYLLDTASHIVHIDGSGISAKVDAYAVPVVAEQVIRGDVSFVKADEDSQKRLAGVPFLITAANGEKHVAVTDENGIFDSSELDAARDTNSNDAALGEDGRVDESKLDPAAGIWFGSGAADDSRGSLPYGAYTIQELRCTANEGRRLIVAGLVVTKDGRTYGLGTFDNRAVRIATSLSFDGDGKACPADDDVVLVDSVTFEGLEPGHEYVLRGELHAVSESGEDMGVVAESSEKFSPVLTASEQDVSFHLDTAALAGSRLVAFERLFDNGELLAEHADLNDEGQTVHVPRIGTTLAKQTDHEADATAETMRVADTVVYTGLEAGKNYTVTGTLRLRDENGAEAGPALDDEGNEIRAEANFTAESPNGSVEVVFEFKGTGLAGKQAVAFEELWHEGRRFAVHADIADEGQLVSFPSLKTMAVCDATQSKLLPAANGQVVTDTVEMWGLRAGGEYELRAELHIVGENGEDSGVVSEARKAFIADGPAATETVSLAVDASGLGSRTLVVFQELWRGGVRVGSHADLGDEDQSVGVPQIHTTLTGTNGQKAVELPSGDGAARIELVDTVSYQGLVPGETYELEGTLYEVENDGAGDAVTDMSGAPVCASASFVAESSDGEACVTFSFDAESLGSCPVVAFERLSWKGLQIAVHLDPKSEPQTVTFTKPEKPQTPTSPDKPASTRRQTPATGDVALPVFACAVLGGLLAFCGWAIVRAGSMGPEDE